MWICSKTVTKSSFYKHVKIYVNLWCCCIVFRIKTITCLEKIPRKKNKPTEQNGLENTLLVCAQKRFKIRIMGLLLNEQYDLL